MNPRKLKGNSRAQPDKFMSPRTIVYRALASLLSLLPVIGVTVCMGAELLPGQHLPMLKGQFLTGRAAVLPEAAAGKAALLALGFTYDSRFAVEAWVKKFRDDFGVNPQVTFYEIPMIGGMAQMGRWFIDSGMRRGTPEADHERVITVYGGTGPWKERLGFKAPEAAYLILLDKNGIVRWRYNGVFDEAAYKSLYADMKALLANSTD